MTISRPIRLRDKWGAGYYGASRGSRTHNGVDFVYELNEVVHSLVEGTVTKVGYAYADDLSYRYVEVQDGSGRYCRHFYVDPSVRVGCMVFVGTAIGTAQDTGKRYPGITPHVHFEVFALAGKDRQYCDPLKYLAGDV